jgi:transcription initiation factor TFIIIB Brf1 subunit/transcription initiation factor TFIIB
MAAAFNHDSGDDRRCRHCHSQNLREDWAQGDRVCMDCGIVDEERLLDDRPEWKDFGEAEDLVKGLPSNARCGLVVVDESRYLGGLQPTLLSKSPFGNPLSGSAKMQKSLTATNRKLDMYMEKEQKRVLKRAKLSLMLKRKHIVLEEHDVTPESDAIVLQQEEEAERAHAFLQGEKWSLERAIMLHQPQSMDSTSSEANQRAELLSRLDKPLKRASLDLYTAYSILQEAAQTLNLAPRIVHQATHILCQYAKLRDGLTVRGVVSRFSGGHDPGLSQETSSALSDYNRRKQMASLSSAILFVEARKHGQQRPLQEICSGFSSPGTSKFVNNPFIKLKHCNKAMKELRKLFPDYIRSVNMDEHDNADHFVEHATRKLDLPPVATASIQVLVEVLHGKLRESTKLSTTCAAVTLLVCMAGTIMQRLAKQAMEINAAKRMKTSDEKSNLSKSETIRKSGQSNVKFDVFRSPALELPSYEMRQMWDAWTEQTPWARSMAALEQAFQTSRPILLECFKSKIFPQRDQLLLILQDSDKLRSTPRASVLLRQMITASPLLNSQGKV